MEIVNRVREFLRPHYEVEDEIGRGGSAFVYRAVDLRHDRKVAIKVLSPEIWSDVKPGRFLREIQIAAQLQHPHILPLFDSGEADGLLYYVMPFVEGESLRDRLAREGSLPIDDALEIVSDVAKALAYAHGQGIIHRDIKPGNILLSDAGAVIADFGIAMAVDHAADSYRTATGHAPGTPAYMSPEQVGNDSVDARSDIYALGCVLYETLAGEPPFTARTLVGVVAKHLSERPPSLDVVRPSVPGGIVDVFERSLAKVPADRFQSADEFAAALQEGRRQKVKMADRRPAHRATLAVATVLILAAGIWGWRAMLSSAAPLDAEKVLVFPLALAGEDDEDDLGWGVALAIGTAFEHTEPLRWVDGWRWLPDEVRNDAGVAAPGLLSDIARGRGAGRYVSGVIRPTGDSIAVVLRLHDTEADSVLGQETAWAKDGETVHEAGLIAIVPLLTRLLEPGRQVDLSPLTDRAPGAIALTIQGDKAYRQSRFLDANEFYRRAVEEDSLLAIAAARGAAAAGWEEHYQDAFELARLAVSHDSLLPLRHRHLVHGVKAYIEGRADSAIARLRLAVESDPNWPEPRAMLGEVYYHLLDAGVDSESEAKSALQQAVSLDTTFMPPLIHLSEIAIRAGDLPQARAWIDRLRRGGGADGDNARKLQLMLECVEIGTIGADVWRREAVRSPKVVLDAARDLAVGGAHPQCAEEAFRAAFQEDASRFGSIQGLQSLLLAQGRINEARQLLDSALASGIRGAYSFYLADAPLSAQFDSGAAEAERLARDPAGPGHRGSSPTTHWLVGLWLAQRRMFEQTAAPLARLDSMTSGPREREARLLGTALRGHIALARGKEEDAVRLFASLSPSAPPGGYYWGLHEALAIEKILLARALLNMDRNEEALEVASAFDHPIPITYLAYLAPSLEIRRRAAQALDRLDLAEGYRRRLADLGWANGEAPLSMSGPLFSSHPTQGG